MNGYLVNNQYLQTWHLSNWSATDKSQYNGDFAQSDGALWRSNFPFPNETGVPEVTSGGGSVQVGYTTNPSTSTASVQSGEIYTRPITLTQNTQGNDIVIRFNTPNSSNVVVAIYKADGLPVPTFSYNGPGTLVCQSSPQAIVTGDNTLTIPSCKLSSGQTYHLAYQGYGGTSSPTANFDNSVPLPTMVCVSLHNNSGAMPALLSNDPTLVCGTTSPSGQWPKLYVDGTLQPFINAHNAIPTNLTTTSATSDNISITGVTASSRCFMTATNASAATNIATTYVSNKTTNQITVTHIATSGMTYDVICF
jgi:hypothetical protein